MGASETDGARGKKERLRTARRGRKIAAATFVTGLALTPFAWALGPGKGGSATDPHSDSPHFTDAHLASRPPQGSGLTTYEWEARTLGADHAREHQFARRSSKRARREWRSMTPAERRADLAADRTKTARINARLSATASSATVGRWTTAPFRLPEESGYAVGMALLPTGKVIMWGYLPRSAAEGNQHPNNGIALLWNPRKGTGASSFKVVNPPVVAYDHDQDAGTPNKVTAAPIFCSGGSLLPTGELFTAGGNLQWQTPTPPGNPPPGPGEHRTHNTGWDGALTFNPFSERWRVQPSMQNGRWYPSQVLLGNGRTVVVSGYDETEGPGATTNRNLDVFSHPGGPSTGGSWTRYAQGEQGWSLYPHLFTLPSGDLLSAGPNKFGTDILDVPNPAAPDPANDWTWRSLGNADRTRVSGNAVLLPAGPAGSSTVLQVGGYDPSEEDANGDVDATRTVETINAAAGAPLWRSAAAQNRARSDPNTVLLPDGNLVTVGGGLGRRDFEPYSADPSGQLRRVELYSAKTGTWRLGPAQRENRTYHSTAVLLPDGRVLSAGDDFYPATSGAINGASRFDRAEVYSPPYLFRGKRPKIGKKTPKSVRYRDSFGIRSTAKKRISKAVLVAPSATTHGADMSQRLVALKILRRFKGRGLNVVAPRNGNIAPPGYYMLFLLNKKGVPSVAKWVKLDPRAPNRASLKKQKKGKG